MARRGPQHTRRRGGKSLGNQQLRITTRFLSRPATADQRVLHRRGARPLQDVGVVGLAQLNSAIVHDESRWFSRPHRRDPADPALAGYAARRLAAWLRTLRFHQAVKRYLDREGLPRRVPVLVGSNEIRPYVNAVYYAAP